MRFRLPAIHLVLVLLLLLSQQMALTHALTHISPPAVSGTQSGAQSRTQSDDQLPREMQCMKCFAFASVGSALASSPHAWSADLIPGWIDIPGPATTPLRNAFRAFDSRAPPLAV